MKNRMLKGAHLSEHKCREIIHLFCEDLTATEIAHVTGVSRVTVNAYLKMIRVRLARFCDEAFPLHFLPSNHLLFKHTPEALPMTHYYGFACWNGLVFSTGLTDMDRDCLQNWQKEEKTVGLYNMNGLHAVADFSTWRLYRKDPGDKRAIRPAPDDISGFWALTRSRLMKFRGLNRNTLYLHIKESEYRYNHRNEDMQLKLLQLIQAAPLQELQASA